MHIIYLLNIKSSNCLTILIDIPTILPSAKEFFILNIMMNILAYIMCKQSLV